jgi:MarR family transcriptional regulator, transcriptional regulator for hemolysin
MDLAFLLNQAAYAFQARLGGELARVGVSVREYCVLMHAAVGGMSQNSIAENAGLDKTTMGTTVDRLEVAGLVRREVADYDKRAKVVGLTESGMTTYEAGKHVVQRVTDEVLGTLDAPTRDGLVDGLTSLTAGPLATPSHVVPQRRKQVPPHQVVP